MWSNPLELQGFALATADGTVLVELPPTMHFESAIGRPEPPKPLQPRTDAPPATSASTTGEDGVKTVEVVVKDTVDLYTWERAPFSNVWYKLGDGLPREKPPEPSSVSTTTSMTDRTGGKNVKKTVTETVNRNVVMNGDQRTTTTTTITDTATVDTSAPPQTHARYVATSPYWGSMPVAPLLASTGNIQAAFEAAYAATLQGKEAWVVEWQESSKAYTVVDKLEAAAPPEIVLTGQWPYASTDEALIHMADIERACGLAAQIMLRGRTLATFRPGVLPLLSTKTADRARDVTYTLTLPTTEYFTAQEFMRRQIG